jgi:anti-sigma regulatory factor (Ser/Thr protein kinase)
MKSERVASGPGYRPAPTGVSNAEETRVPATTAELIESQTLGDLVDRRFVSLEGTAEPLTLARSVVREALAGRTSEGQIDDAVLVTDELVTNAIKHADGVVSLNFDFYEKGVTVGVADRGTDTTGIPTDPVSILTHVDVRDIISLDALPEGGQGLFLVAQFAAAWGVDRTVAGKVVTAAFNLVGE